MSQTEHRLSNRSHRAPHVLVVGAGVIGLGIAWRAAQRGARVTVLDRGAAGGGASRAAAGMLNVCSEAEPSEQDLIALGRRSQTLWPAFAAELESVTGLLVNLRTEGTLAVALTTAEAARLRHHLAFQRELGLPVEWISGAAARAREPHLAAHVAGALWSPQDHQVDNRKLVAALLAAARAAGAEIYEHRPVQALLIEGHRTAGVVLADGTTLRADVVVLAAGAWSRGIEGLPRELRPPVRPVKGQMLALAMSPAAPLVSHVVHGGNVYLVPRRDGTLIVGATVEEKGFDTALTAGGVLSLLEAAWRLVPAIEELPIAEMWVGHRPGSRDDAPLLGPGPVDGLIYATGHHRNGILLAPVTADAIARLAVTGEADPAILTFAPGRFLTARAAE